MAWCRWLPLRLTDCYMGKEDLSQEAGSHKLEDKDTYKDKVEDKDRDKGKYKTITITREAQKSKTFWITGKNFPPTTLPNNGQSMFLSYTDKL